MTFEEVVHIRNYVRGAYPQVKDSSESTDAVWFDMLKDCAYLGILASVKDYIKKGKQYPPTLAEIIKNYEVVLDSHQDDILNQMILDGVFDDPEGTNEDIADWNKENRIDKAKYWMTLEKWQWPKWFLEIYKNYMKNLISQKYIGVRSETNVNRRISV
jgi:hypothetical protein